MDLKELLIPIQHEMNQLEQVISQSLSSRISFVENVVDYVIQNGGKRIRPVLTILAAKLSGYRGDAAIRMGAAIEFLHTASLLHDDVIDNAPIRRGRDATNKKWGNHVSVLVGDFFYCRAMDILVNEGNLKVLRAVTDAVTYTTEGEIIEITKSSDLSLSEDDYLSIIYKKTAALMESSAHTGAILGEVSHDFEEHLRKFGRNIGMAFQIMDDVLDYTASEDLFGKKSGTDLNEGKLTLPLILALRRCTEGEKGIIKSSLISDKLSESAFREVLNIIHQYDGIEDAERVAASFVNKAKENLTHFKPSMERDILINVADYVVDRKY